MPSITLLTEIAEAATPGLWTVENDNRPGMAWNRHIYCGPFTAVCYMAHSDGKDTKRDKATARHIATFNPATMALILAVVKAADEVRKVDAQGGGRGLAKSIRAMDGALAALEAAP
jgi:hypothetical protein